MSTNHWTLAATAAVLTLWVASVPVIAPPATVFEDGFQGCLNGEINGQNGWIGTATNLDPDAALCDMGDWNNEPLSKHLSIWTNPVGGSAATAKHSFTSPTTAWDVRAKFEVGCGETWGSDFFSLLEAVGAARIGFKGNNYQLDVQNGTATTEDVVSLSCDTQYLGVLSTTSGSASSYRAFVQISDGITILDETYSTASTTAPSQVRFGVGSPDGSDNGLAIWRYVLVRDNL